MAALLRDIVQALPGARVVGDALTPVRGLAYDSRRVTEGDLFACLRGTVDDGHRYAAEALAKGARSLLVEELLPLDAPQVVVANSRRALGNAAARFYGDPSRSLRMIGVTGTNGKTTTTYFIRAALMAQGVSAGLIGTVETLVGQRRDEAVRTTPTTPESPDIQRLLRAMVDADCQACVMEASSHGLALDRTAGTEFDIAIFTNLTQDHFEFHRGFDDYFAAKARLFQDLLASDSAVKANKRAVINRDDPFASRFIEASKAPVITYGLKSDADVWADSVELRMDGIRYVVHTPQGSHWIALKLSGAFNVYNSLAAIAACQAEGVTLDAIARGLATTVVPGRFEPVDCGQDFTVVVDYAHTPDSLKNVLLTARRLTSGRVLCVFGAGGDRDRAKRPLMGEVAEASADYAVITSDNPRTEDPYAICLDIEAGYRRRGARNYEIVVDRREAIQRAVALAASGDFIVIAGKGHERYQEIGDQRFHFDDREEAAKAIQGRADHGTR